MPSREDGFISNKPAISLRHHPGGGAVLLTKKPPGSIHFGFYFQTDTGENMLPIKCILPLPVFIYSRFFSNSRFPGHVRPAASLHPVPQQDKHV